MIAIVDSNSNPDFIDYPIPGNDDALRSIELYCALFADAILDGMSADLAKRGVDIGAEANPTMEELPAEAEMSETAPAVEGEEAA